MEASIKAKKEAHNYKAAYEYLENDLADIIRKGWETNDKDILSFKIAQRWLIDYEEAKVK